VLCTPAIADIDADGHDELVLAVSYFFDKDYYDNPARAKDLGDVLKDKYVAGEAVWVVQVTCAVFGQHSAPSQVDSEQGLIPDSTEFRYSSSMDHHVQLRA
jgi:hypothetical protein